MNDLKDFVCLTSHCKCNSKCDDCSECEIEIDKWLLEHDKQKRADAIDECIEKLHEVTPLTVDKTLDMVFVNAIKELKSICSI